MAQTPPSKQSDKKYGGTPDAPPARRNWVDAVGRDAGGAASATFVRAGFTDPALVLRWREIVGPDVARIAQPVRFSARDGALTLLAEPGAALFLGHESRTLQGRINAYLGREAVTRLKFVQGRLTGPPSLPRLPQPAKNLDSGDPAHHYQGPDALKAALQNLARWRRNSSRTD